jgi:hypothetical protein
MQYCKGSEDWLHVTTVFIDGDSGATAEIPASVRMKELSPQGAMGAFTYGRRYGLLAAFNLAAEDDDGNIASSRSDDPILEKVPTKTETQAGSGIKNVLAGLGKKQEGK